MRLGYRIRSWTENEVEAEAKIEIETIWGRHLEPAKGLTYRFCKWKSIIWASLYDFLLSQKIIQTGLCAASLRYGTAQKRY